LEGSKPFWFPYFGGIPSGKLSHSYGKSSCY
jgi:hypothetical protein